MWTVQIKYNCFTYKTRFFLIILTADFQLSPVWLLPVGCLLCRHNCVHPPGIRRVIFFLGHSYNTKEIILNLNVIRINSQSDNNKTIINCKLIWHETRAGLLWINWGVMYPSWQITTFALRRFKKLPHVHVLAKYIKCNPYHKEEVFNQDMVEVARCYWLFKM